MPNDHDATDAEAYSSAELSELEASFDGSIRRRLILWVVRWTFGFAAIAVAVRWRPTLAWLWWGGAMVAFISLLMLITLHVVARRRVELAKQRIADYEELAKAERPDIGM